MGDLLLEVLDYDWNRLAISPNVVRASITEELGAVGEAEVTVPLDDEVIIFVPDSTQEKSNEARWQLWEDDVVVFAGVVDNTTKTINEDNTFTFGGKHRGILLGQANVGRRDFNAWGIDKLYEELLRDNIGKAPIASIQHKSTQHKLHPAINCIIGDVIEGNYWASNVSGSGHYVTIDLGSQEDVVGVRVIPPWWDKRWYKFTVETSTNDSSYSTQGSYTSQHPLSDAGKLISFTTTCRYVRVTIDDSSDNIGRLAAVLVYRSLGDVGADTDYLLPWIENDDSGNVFPTGNYVRDSENGAFNGDGVLGNSLITRLSGTGSISHVFRGTSNSVYFTQGKSGGNAQADIYLDNVFQETIDLSQNTYQTKGFEVVGLSNSVHHLRVDQASGTPQVDYFTGLYATSYRPIRDDDPSIAYYGNWTEGLGESYSNYHTARTYKTNARFVYDFYGDSVKVIGTKGPTYGIQEFYIDGALEDTVDLYNADYQFQQTIFAWSGSYASHTLRGVVTGTKNASSTGTYFDVDDITGNFKHVIYLRSFYETNLRLLTRLSEITNTFLRFNNDGSVDLLGQVGDWSETIIREGENEGGTIINAVAEDDYSETCSAVLALVTGPDDLPIKAFVVDRNAVKRMGLKIRKAENADANDAYLLTRQAWVELENYSVPQKRYTVEYDPEEVGEILVGETTVLHSSRLGLTGNEEFRIGRLVTEYDNG